MVSGEQWQSVARAVRHFPYGATIARVVEVLLVALGVAYVFISDGSTDSQVKYLAWFDLVAVCYLLVGIWVVRRHRNDDVGPLPPGVRRFGVVRRRFSYALTVAASLVGLSAATDVIGNDQSGELSGAIKFLGVVGVFCGWMLLHVGYAGFYRSMDVASDTPSLVFPDCADPGMVEYLYFAVTLGVSFAVSDVSVIRRSTRWHVMVHSVISFLYNSVVVAVAVGVITGR